MGVDGEADLRQYVSEAIPRQRSPARRRHRSRDWHVTACHSAQQYSRSTGAQLGLILGSILVPQTSFLHAGLRFALEFPQAWGVNNGPSQVVADPQANAFILMQLVQQAVGPIVEEVALRSMQRAGFQPVEGSRRTINGLDAFVGTTADQPRPGERLKIVVGG
jgi:hypothetical protein